MIEVKEDYSLKPYNTFAIDVKCRYFVESDEEEALRAFVADYEWQPSEVLILGGGSNFLFTEDFTGTVFYPAMQGKEVIKEDEEEVWVRIGAGVEWDDLWPGQWNRDGVELKIFLLFRGMSEQLRCKMSEPMGWKPASGSTGWKR